MFSSKASPFPGAFLQAIRFLVHESASRIPAPAPASARASTARLRVRTGTCGSDRWVRRREADSGRKIAELRHSEAVYALAFHPAGGELVFSDVPGDIHVATLAPFQTTRSIGMPDFFLRARMQEVSGLRQLHFGDRGSALLAARAKPSTG